MNGFYEIRCVHDKYRLYCIQQTATVAWRGSNDKTTVVRDGITNQILNFSTIDKARDYCKDKLKSSPFLQEGLK